MSKKFKKAEIDIYQLSTCDIIVCSPDPGYMEGPILGEDNDELDW